MATKKYIYLDGGSTKAIDEDHAQYLLKSNITNVLELIEDGHWDAAVTWDDTQSWVSMSNILPIVVVGYWDGTQVWDDNSNWFLSNTVLGIVENGSWDGTRRWDDTKYF